ncbi:MAG: nitroreductase family protein [Ruminiclostridium sp.]|nr:nitroreductase family protein [Ruminiclostridium sp.]
MNSFFELAFTRRSIRKFEDKDIPKEDIEHFVRIAASAPSGCNSQCWRFIAVWDKDVIGKLETAVMKKIADILNSGGKEISPTYLLSKKKMATFFTKAPVVIAVFMTGYKYYDPVFISALKNLGYDDEGIMKLFSNYDLLSVGAAIQNLLLAVHEKGYGACWMSEPAIAGEEINRILGIPVEQRFISLIPVGIPSYTPRNKKMKDFGEVFSIIP